VTLHRRLAPRELCSVDHSEVGMFELGPEKLLMLLLICLVIFGGKRIPEIGGAIGKGIASSRKASATLANASVNRRPT
jgi:sec-independent protein translocase protein TatA